MLCLHILFYRADKLETLTLPFTSHTSNSLINSFLHSSLDLLDHVLHAAARMKSQMCKPHVWQCHFFAQKLSMTPHHWSLPFQTHLRSLSSSTLHFNCSELLTVPKGTMLHWLCVLSSPCSNVFSQLFETWQCHLPIRSNDMCPVKPYRAHQAELSWNFIHFLD